jgi:hypothetical protein
MIERLTDSDEQARDEGELTDLYSEISPSGQLTRE